MYDLTAFQRDALYAIAKLQSDEDRNHGLGVKRQLEEYYEEEIHHGRLYPNLDTLVHKGLVNKGEKDQRTNSYSLTRRGRSELAERQRWEQDSVESVELGDAVATSGLSG